MSRRAISLVEVLVAVAVMAVLGFSIHDTMFATLRGVQVDRVSEARRQLTLDLLERFAHPYSDIALLFAKDVASPAVRELSVDEALRMVAIPDAERALVKSTLASGAVKGFSLVWHRGLAIGEGQSHRLRRDRLWVHTVFTKVQSGPQLASFRVFYVRE
jgi:hypothetical protein